MEMREGDSATLTALAASTKTAARIVGFNLKRTKQEGTRRILRMRTLKKFQSRAIATQLAHPS